MGIRLTVFTTSIITGVIFFFLFAGISFASYKQAYDDYHNEYSAYRQAYQDFIVASSTYNTYKTLLTQNTAMEKMRVVLIKRDLVVSAYFQAVIEKMRETEGFSADSLNTFSGIVAAETAYLNDHQREINSAANIEDLNKVSGDFDDKYKTIEEEMKKAIGSILLAKIDLQAAKVDDLSARVNDTLTGLQNNGHDVLSWQRGLITARGKIDLYQTKRDAAQEVFSPQNSYYSNQEISLMSGQKFLAEGQQYLHEAGNFLLEIMNSLING